PPGFPWYRFHGRFIYKLGESFDFVGVQIQVRHLGRFDARIREELLEVIRRKPLAGEVELRIRLAFRIHFNVAMASDTAFGREETDASSCGRNRWRRGDYGAQVLRSG